MIYICNALSLGMLSRLEQASDARRTPEPITLEHARLLVDVVPTAPAVGHADTAALIAQLLGLPIEKVYARTTVRLEPGQWALIGAYTGPRLPEGATTLPEGAAIEWWSI